MKIQTILLIVSTAVEFIKLISKAIEKKKFKKELEDAVADAKKNKDPSKFAALIKRL